MKSAPERRESRCATPSTSRRASRQRARHTAPRRRRSEPAPDLVRHPRRRRTLSSWDVEVTRPRLRLARGRRRREHGAADACVVVPQVPPRRPRRCRRRGFDADDAAAGARATSRLGRCGVWARGQMDTRSCLASPRRVILASSLGCASGGNSGRRRRPRCDRSAPRAPWRRRATASGRT